MLLLIWFILALAPIKIHAEHCLFSANELVKIKENELVSIDSKKIVTFLKNNPNELEILNFIGHNRQQIRSNDNYKFLLERIINHNGVDHMIRDKRMSQLAIESNQAHHAIRIKPQTKVRLMKITNRIMLVHGIYGSIMACSHQILSIQCGLSAGGLTTSVVISHVEPYLIAKFTPKIVNTASKAIGVVLPKIRFAIRLALTDVTTRMLRTGGAALGGVFDIVNICIDVNNLIDCNTKVGCSDREIRDSIVSLSISGISFIAAIVFTALTLPGIGLIVSLALMAAHLFYNAFSNVAEYNERYHITFDEGASLFFRSLVFMQPSEDVRMLAKRTDHLNLCANMMWATLDNYTETVKGYGMGLGDISLDNNDVIPTRTLIDLTNKGSRILSR